MALRRSSLARQGVERLLQNPQSHRMRLTSSRMSFSTATSNAAPACSNSSPLLLGLNDSSFSSRSFASFSTTATTATTITISGSSEQAQQPQHEYASIIENYIRHGEVPKAYAHIQELHNLFRSKLNAKYCPDVNCANLLLTGMLQEGQAYQQQQQQLYHQYKLQRAPPIRETSDPSSPPQVALQVLEQMNSLARHYGMDMARPDHQTYELVLQIWRTYHPKHPKQMQELLHLFERDCKEHSKHHLPEFPSLAMYQIVMDTWAMSDFPRGASALGATAFLEHMHRYSQNPPEPTRSSRSSKAPPPPQGPPRLWMKPNEAIYTSVIQAWSRSFAWDGPHHVHRLLDEMEVQHCIQPSMETYRWGLLACSRSLRKNAPSMAQSMFDRAWRRYQNTKDPAWRPSVMICNILMHVWAKQGHAPQCEKMFQQYFHPTLAPPNVVTYTTLLNAWSKSKALDEAPERAMEILHMMIDECRAGNEALTPTARTYSSLLNTWGKSERPDAADHALAIFEGLCRGQYPVQSAAAFQRHEEQEEEDEAYQAAAARGGNSSSTTLQDDPKRGRRPRRQAQEPSEHDRVPNLFHANAVLNAFAQQGDGPRAEDFLRRRMPELQLTPCVISYNTVLNAWNKSDQKDSLERVQALFDEMSLQGITPDANTYGSVITAWSNSDRPDAAERAHEVFLQLQEASAMYPANPKLRTGVAECNVLLGAWSRHKGGSGARRAEEELRRMLQPFLPRDTTTTASSNTSDAKTTTKAGAPYVTAKPNSLCFNTVIAGYARLAKSDNQAPERAEALLVWMNELYHNSNAGIPCSPSEWTYSCVIQAWSESATRRTDALPRATRLLEEMIQRFESGSMGCRPRVYSYAALLRTVLKSDHLTHDEKRDKARDILQDMDRHRVVPDHRINRYVQLCEGHHDQVYYDDMFQREPMF